MMFMSLFLTSGDRHVPYHNSDRSIHTKKWIVQGFSTQLFDALDTLIDGVTVKSQALGSLEPVAIFLEQSVEGMHEYFRVFTAGHEQRAECLFDEVVDERAVD